jgi:7-cyano-7-deazaguanine reductase
MANKAKETTKSNAVANKMLLGNDVSRQFEAKKSQNLANQQSLTSHEGNIAILQVVNNPHPDCNYIVRFTCPEFTSICPITSQPDFAHLIIDYLPQKKIVESKSLKLYLHSFRNHGAFHEDCTIKIAKDLIAITNAKWLRIAGYWYPRGGIPIDIFYQQGELPKNTFVPELNVANYRGRG